MKAQVLASIVLLLLCSTSARGGESDAGLNFMPVDENQAISKWIAQLLSHKITIPEKYSYGSSNSTYTATALMYVQDYELGWWDCIKQFSKNSDYMSRDADRMHPEMRHRWILPVRVDGYRNGWIGAEERVAEIKRRFDEHATQIILRNSGVFSIADRSSLLAIIPSGALPEFKAP